MEKENLNASRKEENEFSVSEGYKQLAFGKITDAVRLMFEENPSAEELNRMNLFCISEIRRPRSGAMEIKFFDRLRALEKLENCASSKNKSRSEFYDALERGIKNLESVK
jgi:hypothetical protein